jgi:uncharacterized protein YjbI with pentapeptide repeats
MHIQDTLSSTNLIGLYAKGQRVFAGIELVENENLETLDLSDSKFEESFLSCINFQKANLNNVVFRNCNLKCSDFRYADLTNAIIENCSVEATSFKGAKTDGLRFSDNGYYGVTLNHDDFETNLSKAE